MTDFVLFQEADRYGQCAACSQLTHTTSSVSVDFVPVCSNPQCEDNGEPLDEITYEIFMGLVT